MDTDIDVHIDMDTDLGDFNLWVSIVSIISRLQVLLFGEVQKAAQLLLCCSVPYYL